MSSKVLSSNGDSQSAALLLRLTLGVAFIYHGYGKLFSPDSWAWLGSNMPLLGTETLAPFWGFMAAFSEFVGGILLVFGLLTRVSALFIGFTMAVAILYHMGKNEGYELSLVFFMLAICVQFLGAGKYSVDDKLFAK